ncbi:uncharacterized protein ACLA_049700 [Aspergillus clavatus NRRL 1]|uniref:A-kinase anchor protein 7-like phosphoesterase domain-containing protein n=1 Tax=Aspergillus clavatus (strain ATCC 1007 / CBS 513.65 / DSM 816 / NCTC 3887 / NRRL 1 / QM 1276 / 107) TaxID=344612 RepID=A1CHZ3_ASPCL|nr:uncharacterized protein ACLA_049700 [Aspergillus clavatus NRRL 1]EAW10498.1 conserved hypothetical protein [Aspergillus clavatus NRRL 1]
MSQSNRTDRYGPKREKRPPLTHFLCLPLVNAVSLPQLESSLATFKAIIPSSQNDPSQERTLVEQPLIPDSAVRPIGTLHLTLGVMSLPTRKRLEEAIEFFHSLDLVSLIREAEDVARKPSSSKRGRVSSSSNRSELPGALRENELFPGSEQPDEGNASPVGVSEKSYAPFTISLESLHALPRARAATVLHAAPVDSTSRLYPFCVLLRNKFLEAGFLQGEQMKDKRGSQGKNESQSLQRDSEIAPDSMTGTMHIAESGVAESQPSHSAVSAEDNSALLSEMPVDLANETAKRHSESGRPIATITLSIQPEPKPKIRPLLLHATVVNTIYIRGRRAGGGSGNGNNRRKIQYSFDARDILVHYRDYYIDSQRAAPRATAIAITSQAREAEKEQSSNSEASSTANEEDSSGELRRSPSKKKQKQLSMEEAATFPFVWAKDIPLETICICEMGAKKLDPDDSEMNARLGEQYRVVTERSLDFTSNEETLVAESSFPSSQQDGDTISSDGSVGGGVRI